MSGADFSAGGSDAAAWVGFDWSRERYEDLIGRVIPDYKQQHALMAEAVVSAAPVVGTGTFSILELGAGTGSLARHLLETYPQAVVTALDVSPAMLAECRRTLAPFAERARVVEADLATADLSDTGSAALREVVAGRKGAANGDAEAGLGSGGAFSPPMPYDAVVSRLAIHHLEHAGQEQLVRRVFAALRPGGVFVNSDMIAGEDAAECAAMMDDWRRYMRDRGDDPAEWEQWLVGDDDHPAPERVQLGWLRAAGFTQVETIWKVAGFAMLRAVKATGA
jgi:tRNA (cmo5U34)-methyltransferase